MTKKWNQNDKETRKTCNMQRKSFEWRDEKGKLPEYVCHRNQEDVKHKRDPEPANIWPILKLKTLEISPGQQD